MAVSTRAQFLDVLTASNLLTGQQLELLRQWDAGSDDPRTLAKRLVQEGWLTRWQAQQLLAGRSNLFLGKYKLLDSLGEGGMGTVLKAEQVSIHRIVAIKVMSRAVLNTPGAVERFLREIHSAAALDHPNIVRAYDADCVGKTYFLAMEYVPADDLKAWIRQHRRLPVAWACEVIREAALGLQHAHEHGMVHRDIKPANLLIVSDPKTGLPQVKILDMGLAKFVGAADDDGGLTRTGQIMGTPDYMAPEQGQSSKRADIRADLYALGITLYEMLTGRLPFAGDGPLEKLLARMQHDAPRVRSLRPDVPAEVDQLVAKLLSRDPAQRFQTPAELAQALIPHALGTMPAVTEATVFLEPATEPVSRPQVEARADTSLNGFLNVLANEAAHTPGTPTQAVTAPAKQAKQATPASGATPIAAAYRQRKQSEFNWPFLSVGAVLATLLAAGVAYFMGAFSGEENPPAKTPTRIKPVEAKPTPSEAKIAWLLHLEAELGLKQPTEAYSSYYASSDLLPDGPCEIRSVRINPGAKLGKQEFFEHISPLQNLTGIGDPENRLKWTDEDLERLATLPCVEDIAWIELQGSRFTEQGISSLQLFPKLNFLMVDAARMDDAMLRHLATKLFNLGSLHLHHLGDEAAISEQGIGALTSLKLHTLSVRDAGKLPPGYLAPLVRIATLTTFNATDTNLTDAMLTDVAACRGLIQLWLGGTRVTDAGLPRLSGLTQLQQLSFKQTAVTDAGLPALTPLTQLTLLDLRETTVTEAAVKQLAAVLRNCRIVWDGGAIDPGTQVAPSPVIADTPFFNGQDLTGWEGDPAVWRVENGEIVGSNPNEERGLLLTFSRPVQDFRLAFEARVVSQATRHTDAGGSLVFRAIGETYASLQLSRDNNLMGHSVDGKWILRVPRPQATREVMTDDYNAYEVTVVGNRVRVTINGQPGLDGEYDIQPLGELNWNMSRSCAELRIRKIQFTDLSQSKGDVINLLPLIDLKQDVVAGKWEIGSGGELTSDATHHSRIGIAYRPPVEYDLHVEFTKPVIARDGIAQILVGGDRQFRYSLGSWTNTIAAFDLVKGALGNANPSTVKKSAWLEPGRRYESRIQVRKDGVKSFLDGVLIHDFRTDYGNVSLPEEYRLPDPTQLGLGSHYSPTIIYSVKVREVSGPGTFQRPEDPAAKAAAAGRTVIADTAFFNGKDLTGWVGDKTVWRVENGVLVGSNPDKGYGYLVKTDPPTDFRISFEAKVELHDSANRGFAAGLSIRAHEGWVSALAVSRCLHLLTHSKVSDWNDLAKPTPEVSASIKPDAYNSFELTVRGQRVTIKVNGITAVEDQEFPTLPQEPALAWRVAPNCRKLHVRNIQFTDLTQPAAAAWRPLFNGKDFSGWEQPEGPDCSTEVVDGQALVHLEPGAILQSVESFGDYHLSLEFLTPEPGGGGTLAYHQNQAIGINFQMTQNVWGLLNLWSTARQSVRAGEIRDGRIVPDPAAQPGQPPNAPYRLEPPGSWNRLELVCLGNASLHAINGKAISINAELQSDGQPLRQGRIRFQSSRNLTIRAVRISPITMLPAW